MELPPLPDSHICTKSDVLSDMKDDIKEMKGDIKTLLAFKNAGDRDLKKRVSLLEEFQNKIYGVILFVSALSGIIIDFISKRF